MSTTPWHKDWELSKPSLKDSEAKDYLTYD